MRQVMTVSVVHYYNAADEALPGRLEELDELTNKAIVQIESGPRYQSVPEQRVMSTGPVTGTAMPNGNVVFTRTLEFETCRVSAPA